MLLSECLSIGRPAALARSIPALIWRCISGGMTLQPSAFGGLLFAASSFKTTVVQVNCKVCPYLPLVHHQQRGFPPVACTSRDVQRHSMLSLRPFPSAPEVPLERAQVARPEDISSFSREFNLQESDLKVPFPLILHMILQPVCEAVGFVVKLPKCRGQLSQGV
jgi:hypothetical protein